jgi:AraC-like DNA-binding protein
MTISYEALNLGILAPATALPIHIKGTMLSEASLYLFTNTHTTIAVQHYSTPLCTFIIKAINTTKPVELKTLHNLPGYLWQALTEGEKINTPSLQQHAGLLKNQLLLTPLSGSSFITTIETPGEYIIIEILVTESLTTQFKPLFPSLFNELTQITTIDVDLHSHIRSITTARMSGMLWNYFMESRIKDILFHSCSKMVSVSQNPLDITQSQLEAVNEAAEIITKDISVHISIPDLSRKVGLNEFKLKKFFRHVHGKSIYGYLIHHRMLKAKELLEQNYTVKEVAVLVGYRASDLTTVFYQHFGIYPKEVRKTNK